MGFRPSALLLGARLRPSQHPVCKYRKHVRRIATQRPGARLKVRNHDVRMALAGVDTLHTPLPPEERGAG